jgi:hypothetical protein
VGLLDLVGRRRAQQVAVALDGLLVGELLPAALLLRVLRGTVLTGVVLTGVVLPAAVPVAATAEEPVEQSHGGPPVVGPTPRARTALLPR